MTYDTVIGLEVHIQMNTQTKAFCDDANSFGAGANTHVSAISFAHPGTLPVANTGHIDRAVKLGLALGCEINRTHFFDRKHYFYPDLPKGYQITQDNQPICIGGSLDIKVGGKTKSVKIHHIHMEEDAGKTVHDIHDSLSLVDLNRAGTPLMELVTEPDLSSGEEVFAFIAALQKLLRYIDVSDADMEKGSMRCDCNVSVKPAGAIELGERCEIKNLNSKRYAREAVKYEAKRQIKMVEAGQTFNKQTLHYDPVTNVTSVLREKEGVADYRYFPDPDLPPIVMTEDHLSSIKAELPELPWVIKKRLKEKAQLTEDYAEQLTRTPKIYAFYKELSEQSKDVKSSANLMINQILPSLDSDSMDIDDLLVSLDTCTSYLSLISTGKIAASIAHQQLWPALLENPKGSPTAIAEDMKLLIDTDDNVLEGLITNIINNNPGQVAQYRKGKKALIGFFIGAAMREAGGNLDPKALKEELVKALDNG